MIYPLTRKEYPRYREFQERVWQDIQHNRPTYILLVNIPTSTLWDGRAELPLLEHLDELVRREYFVEAVMPVREPKGRLVVLQAGQIPGREVTENRSNIYVYRRTRVGP